MPKTTRYDARQKYKPPRYLDKRPNEAAQMMSTIPHDADAQSFQLSTYYPLSKPNNFTLKERSLMRLKFKMTPKELGVLRKTLKRTDSPNRNNVLMATNITSGSDFHHRTRLEG